MGIMPLKSLRMARYMKDNVEGIDIPDEIISSMEKKGKKCHQLWKQGSLASQPTHGLHNQSRNCIVQARNRALELCCLVSSFLLHQYLELE